MFIADNLNIIDGYNITCLFRKHKKLPTIHQTACNSVLLVKLTVSQLVKKFPALYGSQRFSTTFTRVRHLFLM